MPDSTRPLPLSPGDVVRVVAPASPFDPSLFEAGLGVLRSWGLVPRFRDDISTRRHYFAGSVDRRVGELHDAFSDPEARLIIAVRGGYGVTSLLPRLDAALLRRSPKPIVGCSDLTALLAWAWARAGVAGLHAPMVEGLGRLDDPQGAERLRTILFSEERPPPIHSALPGAEAWCLAPGIARGMLIGGSLTLLAALCGTPFQPKTAGCILLLEEVGERPYRVDRMLEQLDQSGLLDGIRGVALGDFTRCEDLGGGPTWRDAVDRVFRRRPIPVLAGLPFGHGKPNLAVPIGLEGELDAGAGTLMFRERWGRSGADGP